MAFYSEKKRRWGRNCGWKGNDLTGDNVTSQDATLKKMKINFHLKDCGTWRGPVATSTVTGDVSLTTPRTVGSKSLQKGPQTNNHGVPQKKSKFPYKIVRFIWLDLLTWQGLSKLAVWALKRQVFPWHPFDHTCSRRHTSVAPYSTRRYIWKLGCKCIRVPQLPKNVSNKMIVRYDDNAPYPNDWDSPKRSHPGAPVWGGAQ